MKRMCFLFSALFFLFSCAQSQTDKTTSAISKAIIPSQVIPDAASPEFLSTYTGLKSTIQAKRNALYQAYLKGNVLEKKNILDSANTFLQAALVHAMFPYWYGTVWDFNGITEQPRQGTIACGYFVSTTLKHAGFNLNRYKVAQQYSHSIVNTLCTDVQTFRRMDLMLKHIAALPDNLYIVGLDNHVGFIHKEKTSITFIHSSYVTPGYVVSEEATGSLVLPSSKVFVVGTISGNTSLLIRWLKAEPVSIVP